jgi:hypothetical protein
MFLIASPRPPPEPDTVCILYILCSTFVSLVYSPVHHMCVLDNIGGMRKKAVGAAPMADTDTRHMMKMAEDAAQGT